MEQHTQNEEQNVQTNETSPIKEVSEQTPPRTENSFKEILKFALIAIIIVVPIRLFVAQPFIVSGASMESTFSNGQYLIVDQLSYRFNPPRRGDVIIFRFPKDPSKFFIKRIIGLPGESVEIQNKTITIRDENNPDGLVLSEPYLEASHVRNDFLTVSLEDGEYFVLGDNRKASSDSRVWGTLDEELIIGRALVRLFPINTIEVFPGSYNY